MADEKNNKNGVENLEFEFFKKPEERGAWEAFCKGLYNSEKHTVLGRTKESWVKILGFYCIFYLCLAILFGTCLQLLFFTLEEREPKYKLDRSLIGTNPGLAIRPTSEDDGKDVNFIYFNGKNESQANVWIKKLDDFLKPYARPQTGENVISCSYYRRPIGNEVCKMSVDIFGPCGPKDLYGFRGPSPCIFLKMNKIYGWEPVTHLTPTPDMPKELQNRITSLPEVNRTQIWLTCKGLGPQDREFISNFEYYPSSGGFPSYHYPYRNGEGYLSPLIAVRIVYPKTNVVIGIECRTWAKNIKYQGGTSDRMGSVQFFIMRDYYNVPIL